MLLHQVQDVCVARFLTSPKNQSPHVGVNLVTFPSISTSLLLSPSLQVYRTLMRSVNAESPRDAYLSTRKKKTSNDTIGSDMHVRRHVTYCL